MHAPALRGQLREGLAQDGVVGAHVQGQEGAGLHGVPLILGAEAVPQDAPGLPGADPVQLLGEGARVRGGPEGLQGQHGGGRVVAVGGAEGGGEPGDDDVGTEPAHGPDHVGQGRVVAPDGKRLLWSLGEAEVGAAGEVLLGAVQVPRGQELLGADEGQAVAQFGPDEVLTAPAPGHGEVGRAHLGALGEGGEGRRVLVVGVGRDVQHRAQHLELVQEHLERRRVAHGFGLREGRGGCQGRAEADVQVQGHSDHSAIPAWRKGARQE